MTNHIDNNDIDPNNTNSSVNNAPDDNQGQAPQSAPQGHWVEGNAKPQHSVDSAPQTAQNPSQGYVYSDPYSNTVPSTAYQTPAQPKQRTYATPGQVFVSCVITGVLAVALGAGIGSYATTNAVEKAIAKAELGVIGSDSSSTAPSDSSSSNATDKSESTLASEVAEKALPSVVSIYTYQNVQQQYGNLFGYGQPEQQNGNTKGNNSETMTGIGSGVIISSDGYILTNSHVVDGSSSVKIDIEDKEYDAKVVGSDSSSDLAVLKIDATGLKAIEIGDSANVKVGDWTMAIGSPYGYDKTVTTGIVSALDRSNAQQSIDGTTLYVNMIQTDASINSGNSGGALVDNNGKLIGINTLISSSSGSSAGIGFAIPSNYAMDIAEQIMDKGEAEHAQLGVRLLENGNASDGALVGKVDAGSSAEKAGIKTGDLITFFGGKKVTSAQDLLYSVRSHNVGDKVKITVERDGQTSELEVTLGGDLKSQA